MKIKFSASTWGGLKFAAQILGIVVVLALFLVAGYIDCREADQQSARPTYDNSSLRSHWEGGVRG